MGVIQVQVVKLDGLRRHRPIGEPGAAEGLLVVALIEHVGDRHDRLHTENVHVEVLAVAEGLEAFEGPPGVGPVERGNEPLRALDHLLPADAGVNRSIGQLHHLDIDEGVEDVAPVAIGCQRRQAALEALRIHELGVDAELVLVPQVAVHARPQQVKRLVARAEPAIDLVEVAIAHLAAHREHPVIAEVDAFQRVGRRLILGIGLVEIAEVAFVERVEHDAHRAVRLRWPLLHVVALDHVPRRVVPRPGRGDGKEAGTRQGRHPRHARPD